MSTRHADRGAARSIDEWSAVERDDFDICPQLILPEQFFADARIRIPEQRLMLAVLESALVDFYATATAPSDRERRIFIQVDRWFADDGATWPFSFARICEAFCLEPSVIRARLRRSLVAPRRCRGRAKRGTTAQPEFRPAATSMCRGVGP